MNSSIPTAAKPASAFAVISQKLEQIGVFAPTPTSTEAEHFARCGVTCMTTAANIVGQISTNKKMDRRAKTTAGEEALAFAQMADLCMRQAAACAKPVEGKVAQ